MAHMTIMRWVQVKGTMSFEPMINQQHFHTFWINGKAWGTYEQRVDPKTGGVTSDINVLYGNLEGVSVQTKQKEEALSAKN